MPVHPVDKPLGPTSHDLVARARKLLGTRRVGHAGTLDPLASGVLLLLAGDATRLSPYLTGSDKAYLAWVAFGAATPTWDAEGPVEEQVDASHLEGAEVAAAAERFLTLREQAPPAFSAVKREGRAAYRDARAGRPADLPPRPVRYHSVDLLAFGERASLPTHFGPTPAGWRPATNGRELPLPPPLATLPTALFAVRVAAGTYLRAFARDMGRALQLPSHLAGLVRTEAGGVDLSRTHPPERLGTETGIDELEAWPYPVVRLSDAQAARVRQGQRLPAAEVPGAGTVALAGPDGRLVAIAMLAPAGMRLLRVFPAR